MCLLVFAWDCHPDYRFIFAGNRDEFHARPAIPAQWWDGCDLLAGRDELAGGTWLGLRSDGRFAVVTNFREMTGRKDGLRSRGELITDYMSAGESFSQSLSGLAEPASKQYPGYNLILGDLVSGDLNYQSNRGPAGPVKAGVHGLSNHHLDTPWPKVARARAELQQLIDQPVIEAQAIITLLADRQQATNEELPNTGIGQQWEQLLSSAFIVSPQYGTRCSTAVLLHRNNTVQFVERRFDAKGETTGESLFEFKIGSPG